jgi:CRP/FNR family transcriptional regulator, cyclic AMP receptor protein
MRYPGRRTPAYYSEPEPISEIEPATLLRTQVDAETARKLAEMGIEASFAPGQLIFHEHDESGQFYFVISGSIALEQPLHPRPIRIQTLHEGDFLGWSAVLGSGTRHFQARALDRVRVLTFDGSLLRRKCEEDPRFGYVLMRRLFMIVTTRLEATRAHDWVATASAGSAADGF